jgi:peroxiredoxin
MMLEIGSSYPEKHLPDQAGKTRNFFDLTGLEGLVLFVYSKDNTSG